MYGHGLDDEGYANTQFEILRPLHNPHQRRWTVQFFSWIDGGPTNVETIEEEDLLDASKHRLYSDNEAMRHAYEHGGMRRPDSEYTSPK
jgi:hypothetical protein